MNKYKETFGVDISKDVFDVHGAVVRGTISIKTMRLALRNFLKT
jgi:hypothetical protein